MASPWDSARLMAGMHGLAKRETGSSRNSSENSSSLSGLVSTLVPFFLYFAIFVGIFLVLRRMDDRQYAPRTYLGGIRESDRTPRLSRTLFGWFKEMQKIPDTFVLQHNSLDGYFLLRFLKISVAICFVGCCITWPILFPVNATGGAGKTQLNILSFTNVADKNRYYAHTFVAWIFIGFVFFMITRESIYYINLRQAYLLSPLYASRMSSRTVLFSSVPDAYLQPERIRRMFGSQMKNFWIASDVKELEKKVSERDKIAMKLEGAETKLIKTANTLRLKAAKKGGNTENGVESNGDAELGGNSGSVAARYIKPKQRPTHRLKPLIGKKVDTINWSRSELERLNPEIEADQAIHRAGEAKTVSSIFVEFYTQNDAQAAYQMLAHHQALHMSPRVIGLTPDEVVWSNLRIKWWERLIRNVVTISAVCATVIFWSIPVAVVGAISNINYLIEKLPWLSFINNCPSVLLGLITNALPSVMLAVLMSLLPVYLRLMAKLGGLPTLSTIELRTQTSYFWFQVIQVFLVTTFTSAASSVVSSIIDDPSSATTLLAQNLPTASNFYISYFILQGLAFSGSALLHIVGVILFRVLGKLLDNTPRKMYKRWITLSGMSWGTIFPVLSNLVVISIAYSAIAPLVMGFATIGLYLFYLAYRYNLLFVNASGIDTKGLVYAKALQHVTVGCYLSVICLIGLFAIATAIGPLILMIIFGIFMILYHISLNAAINPLLYYLPRSLESEEAALLEGMESASPAGTDVTEKTVGGGKDGVMDHGTDKGTGLPPPPHKKPSLFAKFFRPDIYCDYATLRRLVPSSGPEIIYDPEIERNAYYHPSITSSPPLLWIPRDIMGISRQEVAHTIKVNPITDEGAGFDEKGKLFWDMESRDGKAPIWEAPIYW